MQAGGGVFLEPYPQAAPRGGTNGGLSKGHTCQCLRFDTMSIFYPAHVVKFSANEIEVRGNNKDNNGHSDNSHNAVAIDRALGLSPPSLSVIL